MNLLITGAAGFIASHVARYFAHSYPNYRLLLLDALTYAGNIANLEDLLALPQVRFVAGDITDLTLLRTLFEQEAIDGVLHLAAESHVDRSISDPLLFARTNVLGTLSLLEVARSVWQERAISGRFYHISTDEVYGTLPLGEGFFTEETRYAPHSPYSASKASSDHFVRAYHDTYGMDIVLSNCSNNYGPYQFPEKLIPLFINNIHRGLPLPVYGEGLNVRDWLYVKDHVRAIDLIFHQGASGETYNVGGNNEWSNIDLIKKLIAIADQILGRPEGTSLSLISYVPDRAGHDLRYAIDSSKLQQTLGWTPTVSFEEGLAETIRWYLDHTAWLDAINSGAYLKENQCAQQHYAL